MKISIKKCIIKFAKKKLIIKTFTFIFFFSLLVLIETMQNEKEEKEKSFAKSKLFINNNVFTTKIEMNDETHPSDPRMIQEEKSTFIPKPFSSFVTSLGHVRKRESMNSSYLNRRGIKSVECLEKYSATEVADMDIYVFAILCGLRSVSQEANETVNKIKKKANERKNVRKGSKRNIDNNDNAKSSSFSTKDRRMNYSEMTINNVWNESDSIENDYKRVLTLSEELHGAKKYQISPHNRFCLEDLVKRMDGRSARCVPPRFAAVIERYKYPSTSVSIFSPGKVVCTGAKTEAVGHYSIMETLSYIREKGFYKACTLSNSLEAENVVGTIEFDFGLDIEKLYENHPDIVSYNKEAFPGATVRPPQIFPAAQLAFESGKIVTMGARGREGLMRILSVTFSLYYEVRKERKNKHELEKKKRAMKRRKRKV